jgi:hypothetical protein
MSCFSERDEASAHASDVAFEADGRDKDEGPLRTGSLLTANATSSCVRRRTSLLAEGYEAVSLTKLLPKGVARGFCREVCLEMAPSLKQHDTLTSKGSQL